MIPCAFAGEDRYHVIYLHLKAFPFDTLPKLVLKHSNIQLLIFLIVFEFPNKANPLQYVALFQNASLYQRYNSALGFQYSPQFFKVGYPLVESKAFKRFLNENLQLDKLVVIRL